MTKRSQHVIPNLNGGWSVKSQGASRATKTFDSQDDAVTWAKLKSKKEGLDLVVHSRDGTVRSIHSYGKDASSHQEQNGSQN